MTSPLRRSVMINPWLAGAHASLRAHRSRLALQDAVVDASRTIMEDVLESSLHRNGGHAADLVRSRVLRTSPYPLRLTVPGAALSEHIRNELT